MGYVTVQEYVSLFGERETIRLTNEVAPGPGDAVTYDSAKVQDALDDASEVVDSYIGKRYVTPVASPPRIIKGWVRNLARYQLHVDVNRVTDTVQAAADLARAQLKDVVAGNLTLPIEEGGTAPDPVTGALGNAASSNDRNPPVFAGTGSMDGYLYPFVGGPAGACWRRGT